MEDLNFFTLLKNRIYCFLFIERFNKKLQIDFPKNFQRWDLIQHLIDKYDYKNYLEIGCDKDQSFSKISVDTKVGVDPISGGNVRKTSDDFFQDNKQNFDIIFIDGLHHYEQVKKDINNSLKFLNKNGFILVHDCLPRTKAHQSIPRYRGSWNGDVWKAIVEARTWQEIETFTIKADHGLGIILNKKNSNILKYKILNFKNIKFEDYYKNHELFMRPIDYKDLQKYI